ncbi:MAG TPA: hypothetical protein VMH22_03575 [bacterium]|nr:hypothetical protein [bacterium]
MKRNLLWLTAAMLLPAAALGQGWVGQQMINRPDGDTCELMPAIAFDAAGVPWVVWGRNLSDTTLLYSRWDGRHWAPQSGVCANAPGVHCGVGPSLCFDSRGRARAAWSSQNNDNSLDVGSSYWTGSAWSPEVQVDTPDADSMDVTPKIASGGGQVWCVWNHAETQVSPYSVYASRWDDSTDRWEGEYCVNPPNGNNNWWCDVAVDSGGKPHVVWTETEHLAIYYSFYDGAQWSAPSLVNDSSRVRAVVWPAPRIVIDREGILHVSYTGVLNGDSASDEFYTRNDGSGWTPSVRVTQDPVNNCEDEYSDIAADRSDNVWIAFERDGGGSYAGIYAVHFDGKSWSGEQRLDDDSAHGDGSVTVALDPAGLPWVAWCGVTYSQGNDDIYCNHYSTPPAIHETKHGAATRLQSVIRGVLCVPASSVMRGASCALLDISGRRVLDLHHGTNDVRALAPGVYFVREGLGTRGEGLGKTRKVVLTGGR